MKKILFLIVLLSSFTVSCGGDSVPVSDSVFPSAIERNLEIKESPEPASPSIEDQIVQETELFIQSSPNSICHGDSLTVSLNLGNTEKRMVYLEKKVEREGKVPPLAGENIHFSTIDITANQSQTYVFKIDEVMQNTKGDNTLKVTPGIYLLQLVTASGSAVAGGQFEVKECL